MPAAHYVGENAASATSGIAPIMEGGGGAGGLARELRLPLADLEQVTAALHEGVDLRKD